MGDDTHDTDGGGGDHLEGEPVSEVLTPSDNTTYHRGQQSVTMYAFDGSGNPVPQRVRVDTPAPESDIDPEPRWYLCTACWQLFAERGRWETHATGPFQSLAEADKCCERVMAGEAIPAGVRFGDRECTPPDPDADTTAWTDIERGDVVYDNEAERVVGTVGHRDDAQVDVEPPDGGTVSISRDDFVPRGRYRAIRL